MSDFAIKAEQRRQLLEGRYRPLVFQGVLDPENVAERLPHGCKAGARYVLAWKAATATLVDKENRVVARVPRHPVWYLTVTAVEGGPRKPRHLYDKPWVVHFNVTDIRDTDVFLRPGGGDSSVDLLGAGAKPPSGWLDVRARTQSEFDHQRRLAKHAEEQRLKGRERSKARRKRAA